MKFEDFVLAQLFGAIAIGLILGAAYLIVYLLRR